MKLNRNFKVVIYLIFLSLALTNCDNMCNYCSPEEKGPGAIVLTFDDKYINEWFTADSIFSIYEWKATFCVTKYGMLTDSEKQKLMTLQNNEHEIASHGGEHFRATEYLSNHTLEEYTNEEILPSLDSMEYDGFDISSFVYPFGSRSVETDLTLFNYFSVLRGTTWKHSAKSSEKCFVNKGTNEMIAYGLGIDSHYEYFSTDYILSLLKYANEEDLAVIFYGHNIDSDDTPNYVTSYNTLHEICNFAQQNDMEFLTLKELTNFRIN